MAKSDKRGLAPFATSREGQILYPILRSAKSADEYVDSAIAHNIQHSLRLYQYGGHFRALQELYEAGELTSAINRVVEDVNHRFTVDVLTRTFRSHDLGVSARRCAARTAKRPSYS